MKALFALVIVLAAVFVVPAYARADTTKGDTFITDTSVATADHPP